MDFFALRPYKELNEKKWEPDIPKSALISEGWEDGNLKRVCLCPTVGLCLTALGRNCGDLTYGVYKLDDPDAKLFRPPLEMLPDGAITQEVWALNAVNMRYVGAVHVLYPIHNQSAKYKRGVFEAETFYWEYNWIEGPNDPNGGFII